MEPLAAKGRSRVADAGSIVVGWLTRISVTLVVLGVTGFEVLSIVVAHVSIQDYGSEAGQAAISSYSDSHRPDLAYLAAMQVAEEHNATIPPKTFRIMTDGSVSFEIKTTATTLLLYRWDRTAKWAQIQTTIYEQPIEQTGQLP